MRAWQPLSLKRTGVGMALAILAWAAAPGSAYASCGDYVVMGSGHLPSDVPPAVFPNALREGLTAIPALPRCSCLPGTPVDPAPIPCPGCSSRSPGNSAAVPGPMRVTFDSAIATERPVLRPCASVGSLVSHNGAYTVRQVPSVFRPPRHI